MSGAAASAAPAHPYGPAYPFPSRFITLGGGAAVAGLRMHYVDEGSGPVVVCLHGNPTWGFMFRNLVARLRRACRLIVPDHVGCGLSDKPVAALFRAADRVAHLEELLDRLGINRFSLVMHDWGGPLGTGLAVRRPAAVERLVYLNTTLAETELLPAMIRRAAAPLLGRALTQHTPWFLGLLTSLGAVRPLPEEVAAAYHAPFPTRASRRAIWGFVRDIPLSRSHPTAAVMDDMVARLPAVAHLPVKIVWGMQDPCFHPGILERIVARFPRADVVRVPDASHLVIEDAPDRVLAEVSDFLRSRADAAAPSRSDSASHFAAAGGLVQALSAAAEETPWIAAATTATAAGRAGRPGCRAVDFGALAARIDDYGRGLAAVGLGPGDRVIMLVPPGADFLALSYGIMSRGGVPVFIDPGIGGDAVVECMHDAAARGFVAVPRAHLLRLKAPDLFRGMAFRVVAGGLPVPGAIPLRRLRGRGGNHGGPVARGADDPALVAFTSGATGRPKGVVFTNRMLAAQLGVFRDTFGFRAGEQDVPLLPAFSLFGVALGVGCVFPPLDAGRPLALDPDVVVRMMAEVGATTSFGSPTIWARLADHCRRTGGGLPDLRRVFMAVVPVSAATLELVSAACPAAECFTPYGATEALPVTLGAATDLHDGPDVTALSGEQGTPVGRPIAGLAVRVVQPPAGEVIERLIDCPPRVIGEIVVAGDTVSGEYLGRPEATRVAKVLDGGRRWHRMGDMGYLDERGRLWFCGRAAHVVVAAGRTLHSVPVETVFNRHPDVSRTALVGVAGQAALVVEPRSRSLGAADRLRLAGELRGLGAADPVTAPITMFHFHDSFPVDARHNAKIHRERLAVWAATQEPVVVETPAGEDR